MGFRRSDKIKLNPNPPKQDFWAINWVDGFKDAKKAELKLLGKEFLLEVGVV